jgi:hypothetical protein
LNINREKIILYFLLIFFAGFLLVKGIFPAWSIVNSDFANYYVSAKLIVDKVPLDSLYDNAWFQNKIASYGIETPGKFSPFPPITAWLMMPLASLEPLTAQRVFTVVNLFFVLLGIGVLKKLTSWTTSQSALLLLSGGLSLTNNVAFGQVYLIMTVFILISFLLVQRNHLLPAGLILGVFTALKYFPIVIISGYFLNGVLDLYQRKKSLTLSTNNTDLRVVFYSLSTFIVLLLFQYLYFGNNVMREFIHSSFLPHLDGELKGQGMFSYQFQSWDNFLRNLFVYDEQANPHPFIPWSDGKTFFKIVIGLVTLIVTMLTLYRFRSLPASVRRPVFLSLPALAALVFLPASATYHFIFLISSFILILAEFYLPKKFIGAILLHYVLIGLIPYSFFFFLAKEYGLLFAYPRLGLISCLFVLVFIGFLKNQRLPQS